MDPASDDVFRTQVFGEVAEDLLQLGLFGELVIDDGFYIFGSLDLVQLPLQFFIIDIVEMLSLEYLLDVFLSLLSYISDHLTELLVSLALLCLFR